MNNRYGPAIALEKAMTASNRKKTLKQRFRDWLYDSEYHIISDSAPMQTEVHLSGGNSIRFEVYFANGGRVIQTRRFDERKDRHYDSLYVITSDQDFSRELDKILTQEALRS